MSVLQLYGNTKISKNLKYREVIASKTARKLGIRNHITDVQVLFNCMLTANHVYEPVRKHFGKPVYVSSFYRSLALNQALPGASKYSQHMTGQALDLDADVWGGMSNYQIFEFVKNNLDFDELINEHDYSWIHVSYRLNANRRRIKKIG